MCIKQHWESIIWYFGPAPVWPTGILLLFWAFYFFPDPAKQLSMCLTSAGLFTCLF